MANRNAKTRKYSDFILNLFYFVSVYFVSIIYDYANNYIILNNHEAMRQVVMCITKGYLMLVPFITIVLISCNENSLLDAIIDSVVDAALEIKVDKIINDKEEDKKVRISSNNHAIGRIPEKCINCGQCKKTCENIVNLRYDLNKCKEPICIGCGRCILN